MSRSVSSAAEAIAARSSSGERPSARASSSSVRRIASGVRSSWLASATKDRSWASASASRSSISFKVRPSRATSSWLGGTGSCPSGSAAEIVAARARIASTGRSAAAATP